MAVDDEEGLQMRAKIMRTNALGKQVLAIAEMEVPPGRHVHQLPLLCAVSQGEGVSGLLSLNVETEVELVHLRSSCDGCGVGPIHGTRYCCSDCKGYSLCGECYGRKEQVHPDHDFFKVGCCQRNCMTPSAAMVRERGEDQEEYSSSDNSTSMAPRPSALVPGATPFASAGVAYASTSSMPGIPAFQSTVSAAAARIMQAELRSEDLIVHLHLYSNSEEENADTFEHPGLLCVANSGSGNSGGLLVESILPGMAAACWNQAQADRGAWEAQIVEGDVILEVDGISGQSELMATALCAQVPILSLRIMRPTCQARAVLDATGGDLHAARDILLGDAAAVMPLHLNRAEVVCQICAGSTAVGEALRIRPCGHGWFCKGCIQHWASAEAVDGRCAVSCPIPECRAPIGHRQLRAVLTAPGFERLMRRSVEQLCAADDDLVACPTPDCPYRAWLAESQEPRLCCEVCRVESCVRCGTTPYHHGLTCEEEARRSELSMGVIARTQRKIEETLREALVRRCPGCHAAIERTDACCHMTCSGCGYEFSWVCGSPWGICRQTHRCLRHGIYLPDILRHVLRKYTDSGEAEESGFPELTEDEASDIFLELRCVYMLSKLRHETSPTAWEQTRGACPELLRGIIRGRRGIAWSHIGHERRLQRLRRALPDAFPAFT